MVDLRHFESVHGMSRVAKLMPDKVATALAINQEKSLSQSEDGSFLIDLVIKLASVYRGQAKHLKDDRVEAEQDIGVQTDTIFSFGVEEAVADEAVSDFDQVLDHFLATLESFKEVLRSRTLEKIR